MPYRDFALLQPPGLVLVLTPYALLSFAVGSSGALMVLTACTPLLAAANVALVGRLVAPRGWRAALAACGLMAIYPATYEALLDGMLEPLMILFCLVGALLVFDRGDWSRRWRLRRVASRSASRPRSSWLLSCQLVWWPCSASGGYDAASSRSPGAASPVFSSPASHSWR